MATGNRSTAKVSGAPRGALRRPAKGGISKAGKVQASQYRGLTWDRQDQRWRVRINIGGRQSHVGRFGDEITAARTYDKAALLLHGDSAVTNFDPAFSEDVQLTEPLRVLLLKYRGGCGSGGYGSGDDAGGVDDAVGAGALPAGAVAVPPLAGSDDAGSPPVTPPPMLPLHAQQRVRHAPPPASSPPNGYPSPSVCPVPGHHLLACGPHHQLGAHPFGFAGGAHCCERSPPSAASSHLGHPDAAAALPLQASMTPSGGGWQDARVDDTSFATDLTVEDVEGLLMGDDYARCHTSGLPPPPTFAACSHGALAGPSTAAPGERAHSSVPILQRLDAWQDALLQHLQLEDVAMADAAAPVLPYACGELAPLPWQRQPDAAAAPAPLRHVTSAPPGLTLSGHQHHDLTFGPSSAQLLGAHLQGRASPPHAAGGMGLPPQAQQLCGGGLPPPSPALLPRHLSMPAMLSCASDPALPGRQQQLQPPPMVPLAAADHVPTACTPRPPAPPPPAAPPARPPPAAAAPCRDAAQDEGAQGRAVRAAASIFARFSPHPAAAVGEAAAAQAAAAADEAAAPPPPPPPGFMDLMVVADMLSELINSGTPLVRRSADQVHMPLLDVKLPAMNGLPPVRVRLAVDIKRTPARDAPPAAGVAAPPPQP